MDSRQPERQLIILHGPVAPRSEKDLLHAGVVDQVAQILLYFRSKIDQAGVCTEKILQIPFASQDRRLCLVMDAPLGVYAGGPQSGDAPRHFNLFRELISFRNPRPTLIRGSGGVIGGA